MATLLLAVAPSFAHSDDAPDVSRLALDPRVDLSEPLPLAVQHAIAVSEDVRFFDRFPAFSPITRYVAQSNLPPNMTQAQWRARRQVLAITIANTYSAEDIMTLFGQTVYLGAGCDGFAQSMEVRIGVPLEEASLRDILSLATLIKSPAYLEDPERGGRHFAFLAEEGAEAGFRDEATAAQLKAEGRSPLTEANCLSD